MKSKLSNYRTTNEQTSKTRWTWSKCHQATVSFYCQKVVCWTLVMQQSTHLLLCQPFSQTKFWRRSNFGPRAISITIMFTSCQSIWMKKLSACIWIASVWNSQHLRKIKHITSALHPKAHSSPNITDTKHKAEYYKVFNSLKSKILEYAQNLHDSCKRITWKKPS